MFCSVPIGHVPFELWSLLLLKLFPAEQQWSGLLYSREVSVNFSTRKISRWSCVWFFSITRRGNRHFLTSRLLYANDAYKHPIAFIEVGRSRRVYQRLPRLKSIDVIMATRARLLCTTSLNWQFRHYHTNYTFIRNWKVVMRTFSLFVLRSLLVKLREWRCC